MSLYHSLWQELLEYPPFLGGYSKGDFIALGLDAGTVADHTIIRRAVWVYAAYRAHCDISHRGSLGPIQNQELLKQFAREAVQGHPQSAAIVDGSFINHGFTQDRSGFQDMLDTWDDDI